MPDPPSWPGFELAWKLARRSWGNGYATEGARAALAHAFDTLDRDRVISLIHPENRASIRVAERIGERLEGRADLLGREVLRYGIGREDYRRQQIPVPPGPGHASSEQRQALNSSLLAVQPRSP